MPRFPRLCAANWALLWPLRAHLMLLSRAPTQSAHSGPSTRCVRCPLQTERPNFIATARSRCRQTSPGTCTVKTCTWHALHTRRRHLPTKNAPTGAGATTTVCAMTAATAASTVSASSAQTAVTVARADHSSAQIMVLAGATARHTRTGSSGRGSLPSRCPSWQLFWQDAGVKKTPG